MKMREQLEHALDALQDAENKAEKYKKALLDIFNDALCGTNMGDYTCKGLMHLIMKKLLEVEGALTKEDFSKMFK